MGLNIGPSCVVCLDGQWVILILLLMGRYKILIFAIFAVVMAAATAPLRAQTEVQMINGDTINVDACMTPTGTTATLSRAGW